MLKALAVLVSGLSAVMLCGASNALQIRKSGTITINSGWKSNDGTGKFSGISGKAPF